MSTEAIHVPSQQPRAIPCKIAFLGEAPGEDELDKGLPFVGADGGVFNAALRAANLDRADYWIGHVFDQKLPDDDLRNWCGPDKGPLSPIPGMGHLRAEFHWQLDRLAAELAAVQPSVIVPLGPTALWALTGMINTLQVRGNVMPCQYTVPGLAKVLPTYHPGQVRAMWKFLPVFIGDLIKAAVEADKGPQIVFPEKELLIGPSIGDLMAWEARLLASDLLSVDIETGWGQITCIGFAPDARAAICVPFVDLQRPSRSYWPSVGEELTAWLWVDRILGSPVPKLGQNYGGYDASWLLVKHGIRTMNMAEDTRLLHHALYPELPKDLASMSGSYTSQGAWKVMRGTGEDKRDN